MRANRLFVIEKNWRAHLLMRRKIFRQRRSAALQKISVSPFANRHSLLAIRYSPPFHHSLPFPDLPICRFHDLPIRFGSAGASPSQISRSISSPNGLRHNYDSAFGKEAA
jgi:hypothetical protein